ncbi:MAG: ACT domain-containing protein [Sulfuricaulis sp.]
MSALVCHLHHPLKHRLIQIKYRYKSRDDIMACTHKDSCALFPVISLSSALKIWQTFYCDGKYETCLRYQRSLKGEKVPPNLLPNGKALDLMLDDRQKPVTVISAPAVVTGAISESVVNRTTTTNTKAALASTSTNPSYYSYYLRFRIQNVPGLADKIVQEIRKTGTSIDATFVKPSPQAGASCLIIITDQGPELELYQAILRIEAIEGVIARVKSIPLEKQDNLQAA